MIYKSLLPILKSIIVILVLGFLWRCAPTSQPSKSQFGDYGYKYESTSPIQIKHAVIFNGDDYMIYLSINIRRLRSEKSVDNFFKNVNMSYVLKNTYTGENALSIDSISPTDLSIYKQKDVFICKLKINRTTAFPPYLFIKIADKKTSFLVVEDITLETEGKSDYGSRILYNVSDSLPVFEDYIIAGKQYKLEGGSSVSNLYVNLIKYEFPPASPPMSTSMKNVKRNLDIDSVFTINPKEELTFEVPGLYLLQEDTSKNEGLGFRVEVGKYPKYTKVENLIKSVIYISTPEEIKALSKSDEPKNALDNYWLRLGGNANDAKRIIKNYYDRVEIASEKFTAYKEGWKSDKGIIYIVFGQPDFVYRNNDQEQWVYQKSEGMSEVKFTFVKVPNIYSNNHYELIRYPEYEDYWYAKVDLWRKGAPGI